MKRGDCMYTALEVAKYIINKCIELNRPISNLQLQKILYYVQGEYMKCNDGQPLFNNEIMAWQYGPVVPEVYYEYNKYCSNAIIFKECGEANFNVEDQSVVDSVISEKSKLNAWSLVKATHSEDPWKNTFNNNPNTKISKDAMREWFA